MRVEDDEDIQDMPDTQVDGSDQDAAAPSKEAVADSAKSSDAQGETEASTLSLVRDVVNGKQEAAAASPAEGQEAGQQSGDGAPKTDPAEDYSDVPFNKHPRFQQVLKERREFQADATRYRNVDGFLRSNNVSAEEAAEVLTLAAMAKADPLAAYERLKPIMLDVMTRAGVILPADLQQAVDKGEYTPKAAEEVSRLRARQQSTETQQQLREQQAQQRQLEEQRQSITTAATSWEADRRAKDPNFEAKLKPLMREVAFLQVTEGKPMTSQGVTEQLARAYKAVNASFVPPAPPQARRTAIRPVVGGQVNGSARPAPQSTLDIIRAHAG